MSAELAAGLAAASGARAEQAFGQWCVEVDAAGWTDLLQTARDVFGLVYLDWLGGVDEADGHGFTVVAHLLQPGAGAHLLVRTRLSTAPRLASAVGVFPGAGWHERETAEMYGIVFLGHPDPAPLLLHIDVGGHPLRKDFALAARVARPWPGSVDPTGKERRRVTAPGTAPGPVSRTVAGTDTPEVAAGEPAP